MRGIIEKIGAALSIAVITMMANPMYALASDGSEYVPNMYGSFWALIPPVVAIILALVTKEVYSSLFVGIIMGGMFYSAFNFEKMANHVLDTGLLGSLSDSYNVGVLIFLVLLGAMVCLMNKAKGSAAFGYWASTHIKTRVGAQLATITLGMLIFIDDYFNCLTVGSVMKPVTDKHKISREKLAYLIDSTAAPICIIAPISSWAAAVSGYVDGEDGFMMFVKSIPYNFYAIFTILTMTVLVISKKDFKAMKKYEVLALEDNLDTEEYNKIMEDGKNGSVLDLVVPIIILISSCVIGMIYTGGFFSGENIITAFSNADASYGLALGSLLSLILTVVWYVSRRVIVFQECMECIPEGFKAMVPAIMILTLAWTLKAMTDSLGARDFVAGIMSNSASGFMNFLPAIIFIVACFLAFATGTSWGTFGILIPIVVGVFEGVNMELMIMSMSACMAGAVCGDHCSPISDTTIMASAGAECNHVNHVSTQLPYAVTVAGVSFVTYIVAGFVQNIFISLPVGLVMMAVTLYVINSKLDTYQEV